MRLGGQQEYIGFLWWYLIFTKEILIMFKKYDRETFDALREQHNIMALVGKKM